LADDERRDSVVIDSNLMLLLIAYEALRHTPRPPLERVSILFEVRGRGRDVPPEQFERLWLVFQNAKRKVITQHVVAELYNLRQKLGPLQAQSSRIWEVATQLLNRDHIEEHSCSLAELCEDEGYSRIVRAIGPADTGLIFTAERLGCEILSEDGELSHWSWTRRVPCRPLKAL
jgi:rRNA-processing protein FCF1